MALRENFEISGATSSSPSALAGLPAFWDTDGSTPKIKWEKWCDIFTVAVNAKLSITIRELLRTPTEVEPRQPAFINNLNEQAAERKVVSILFLSLGSAERKNLINKYPYMVVSATILNEMKDHCEETFRKSRNRTFEIYQFFAGK